MSDELYTILDRIWLEGHYNGDFISFNEWLYEDDSRESWLVEQIRNALTEKSEKPTSLSWEDIARINDIIGHTPRLTKDVFVRSPKDFFTEVLKRYGNTN